MRRRLAVVTVCALAAGIAGCGSDDVAGSAETPTASAALSTLPTLVTQPASVTKHGAALVSGVLGISAQNCITLDGVLLVAPYGSTVVDARTVDLAGIGRFTLGETPRGGGGYNEGRDGDVPAGAAACFAPNGAKPWVAISAGRR